VEFVALAAAAAGLLLGLYGAAGRTRLRRRVRRVEGLAARNDDAIRVLCRVVQAREAEAAGARDAESPDAPAGPPRLRLYSAGE
jgi:hypothetical protein